MTQPLSVGVIGLGPLWHKRYRPALLALPGLYRIAALCDQIEHQAAREARHLDCLSTAGPTELLEIDEVEAVLLLDPQWYRLWPLEAACRVGKPVFCCGRLDLDAAHADRLYELVQAAGLPVMLEMPARAAAVLGRLRELLATQLGACQVLLCEASEPAGPAGQAAPRFGSVAALLDCASVLLPGEPISALAIGAESAAYSGLVLEFDQGRFLQVGRWRGATPRAGLRLQAIAERGIATAHLPNRLHWTDAAGSHTHVLPADRPVGQVLLERFFQVVRAGQPPEPSWQEAYRLLRWMRAVEQSRKEGRRVVLGEQTTANREQEAGSAKS
jgi:predicted dehydrogenase